MPDKPLILVVDRCARNRELLAQFLEQEGYQAAVGADLAAAERLLDGQRAFALSLIDVAGLGRPVWDYCARLRRERVPFVIVAPVARPGLEKTGVACGAVGVLVKPLSMNGLRGLLRGLLERPA